MKIGRVRAIAALAVALLGAVACDENLAPESRMLAGSWRSESLEGVTIRMTVAETARSVDGAGSWLDPGGAVAFGVSGAVASNEVALLFDFPVREDVSFQGFLSSDRELEGALNGGGFQDEPVVFERESLSQ